MEFVEINANRQPRLSGGRRGASTLLPGGNAVSNNLVPASMLPASAGNLDAVFKDIKMIPKKLIKKSGGAYVMRDGKAVGVGSDSDNFKFRGGAMIMNPDGTTTGVGSDDMSWRRIGKGRPKKANVASGLFHHTIIPEGGKMSKLVPRHGHGAYTSIGTNYQLGQFGGSMTQPIGNTASTLSPALSGMSVGGKRYATGLGKITPEVIARFLKHAGVKKAVRFVGSALHHVKHGGRRPIGADPKTWTPIAKLKGGDLLGDIIGTIKGIGLDLLKELGPELLDIGKDLLKDGMKDGLKGLMSGYGRPGANGHGVYSGGDFLGDFVDGLKMVVDNDFVKGVLKELGGQVLDIGKDMLKDQMKSGLSGLMSGGDDLGAPQSLQQVYGGSRLRPGQYNLYRGKKTGGMVVLNPDGTINKNYKDQAERIYDNIYHVSNPNKNFDLNRILEVKKKGGRKPIGADPRTFTPKHGFDMDDMFPSPVPDPIMRIMGKGRPSARGAIVKRIMKEKNLSLPMASKYVKEHGLY